MTEENPDFEKYQSIAREIAGRTGNATLARSVMGAYLDIAKIYNYYHGRGDPIELSKVEKVCTELDHLANEHNERKKIESILEETTKILDNLDFWEHSK